MNEFVFAQDLQVNDEVEIDRNDWLVLERTTEYNDQTKVRVQNLFTTFNQTAFFFSHTHSVYRLRSAAERHEQRSRFRSIMGDADDMRRENSYERGEGWL